MDLAKKIQLEFDKLVDAFKEKLVKEVKEEKELELQKEQKLKKDVRVVDTIRPTLDILSHNESTIKITKIEDNFKELIKDNTTDNNEVVAEVIERINNPSVVTKDNTSSGLQEVERKWLFDYIYTVEGGYSNNIHDLGGETNYGIIVSVARKWGYNGEMKDLPKELSLKIYLKDYYEKFKLYDINHFGKQLCIFDSCVHSGTNGIKIAQKALNKAYATRNTISDAKLNNLNVVLEDGKIGEKTIKALNDIPFGLFYMNFIVAQENYYEKIFVKNPTQVVFDDGWENRIYKKNQFIYHLVKNNIISWE